MKHTEIENQDELNLLIKKGQNPIKYKAFQGSDFTIFEQLELEKKTFKNCIFLGAKIPDFLLQKITKDNLIFPQMELSFNPFIGELYNWKDLFNKYKIGDLESYKECMDYIVYKYQKNPNYGALDIKDTLARSLHDHSVSDALYDFIADYKDTKIVAIMGGHTLSRKSEKYLQIVNISKKLTEMGYLMISGGGPGAMEATHVGAYFAGETNEKLNIALKMLSVAEKYNDELWLDSAFQVLDKYPTSKYKSLGIPTWLYGHEPPTPFATHIAKYFANSIREDGLLAIAKGGVIFAPGSAGTFQEIFQEAAQNHYQSFGIASPMVFLGKNEWEVEKPIYPLLNKMQNEGKYKNLILSITDKEDDVIKEIENFDK